jgi:hypothetical protein
VIEVDNQYTLKEKQIRSILSTDERLQDTIKTIECINRNDPHATIFLIEGSKTFFNVLLEKFQNLNYFHLEKVNPITANLVRTHQSKSFGECIMLLEFLKTHKSIIFNDYDYLIKLAGRYYFINDYLKDLTTENTNKILMKKSVYWNKSDLSYIPEYFLPNDMYVNDRLGGYYTVAYGIGKYQLNSYETMLFACAGMTDQHSKYFFVDVEYLIYKIFFDLKFSDRIVDTDWVIEGRGGQNGKYFIY